MEKQKIGLTPINWFLSILGIILLSCIIILPPVFRIVFKVEAEEEINEIPDEVIIEKLTCVKDKISSVGHTEDITYNFDFNNNKVQVYSKKTVSRYSDYIQYDADKQTFGRYTGAFNILSGYKYLMEPDDVNYILTVTEDYDLTTFKNTTITIPGDTEETKVTSIYQITDTMDQIKNTLINSGYNCE